MSIYNQIKSLIPNGITLAGLGCGSLAVFFAIDGHLSLASLFILGAALCDFLDGLAARLLHSYSETGKELDSLADIVSFGLAPGAILFTLYEFALFGKNQPIQDIEGSWSDWLILLSALFIPVFSALRLAKFNVSESRNPNFTGLPTPANAMLWASFGLMLAFPEHAEVLRILYTAKNFLIILLITSLLLVSGIPMFSIKFKDWSWGKNRYRYSFLLISAILILFLQFYALFFIIVVYILSNMVLYLFRIKL
jgi:CDP-diacylglycerol---serine O-phosphatidyltransferase